LFDAPADAPAEPAARFDAPSDPPADAPAKFEPTEATREEGKPTA
jgi:hypothetical protein